MVKNNMRRLDKIQDETILPENADLPDHGLDMSKIRLNSEQMGGNSVDCFF